MIYCSSDRSHPGRPINRSGVCWPVQGPASGCQEMFQTTVNAWPLLLSVAATTGGEFTATVPFPDSSAILARMSVATIINADTRGGESGTNHGSLESGLGTKSLGSIRRRGRSYRTVSESATITITSDPSHLFSVALARSFHRGPGALPALSGFPVVHSFLRTSHCQVTHRHGTGGRGTSQ